MFNDEAVSINYLVKGDKALKGKGKGKDKVKKEENPEGAAAAPPSSIKPDR